MSRTLVKIGEKLASVVLASVASLPTIEVITSLDGSLRGTLRKSGKLENVERTLRKVMMTSMSLTAVMRKLCLESVHCVENPSPRLSSQGKDVAEVLESLAFLPSTIFCTSCPSGVGIIFVKSVLWTNTKTRQDVILVVNKLLVSSIQQR